MAKGIIVVDIPKRCKECQFCRNYVINPYAGGLEDTHDIHCVTYGNKVLERIPKDGKPDWCPIKPMPEKKMCSRSIYITTEEYHQRKGWNKCIDKIEGRR